MIITSLANWITPAGAAEVLNMPLIEVHRLVIDGALTPYSPYVAMNETAPVLLRLDMVITLAEKIEGLAP